MAEINNPKAFPSKKFDKRESQRLGGTCYSEHESGMTLRDYFAAKVITGAYTKVSTGSQSELAKRAYEIADAMLKQREL